MSIQVTVGQVPGTVKDVTLDEVVTVAEAIRKAGFSANGYEIRVNNAVTTDFNQELEDEDIVSLVKNVKGNASVSLLSINVTLPGGETKRVFLAKGEFLISLKKSLGLPEKFSDYKWIVAGEEQTNKQYELTRDCSVSIELAHTAEEADIAPVEEELVVAPKKKTSKKKAESKTTPIKKKAVERAKPKKEEEAVGKVSKKKTQEKNGSETVMTVKWLDGATTMEMEVRHGMRCSEFLRVVCGPDAKWSNYIVSKNGEIVKLGFVQLKDGDTVTIEEKGAPKLDIVTPEPIAEPSEEVAVCEECIAEACCEATESTNEPCTCEEPIAEPSEEVAVCEEPVAVLAEEVASEPCTCEDECAECNCRDSAQDTPAYNKKTKAFDHAVAKAVRCINEGYEIVSVNISDSINTFEDPDTRELKESSEIYLSVVIRKFE